MSAGFWPMDGPEIDDMNARLDARAQRRASVAAPEFAPDFDHVYMLTRAGTVTDAPDGYYAPDVTLAPAPGDVDVSGGWSALTGHTGQHGYNSAVMHPSELWGAWALEDLARLADDDTLSGVAFALVEVQDEDGSYPDGDAIGWAVVYQGVTA